MNEYKNTILLKDCQIDYVYGIILTNESEETIQDAIYKAKREFYDLEEQNDIPFGIYCELDYIRLYLGEKYDIEILDFQDNAVYC